MSSAENVLGPFSINQSINQSITVDDFKILSTLMAFFYSNVTLPFYHAIYFYTISFTLYILHTCKGEGLTLKLSKELFCSCKNVDPEVSYMKTETW
jgi:hypothetical protein